MGLLGCLINYLIGVLVGINFYVIFFMGLYDNYLSAIAFQFLLVKFTIIYPLEKKEINVKEILNKLIVGILIINFLVFGVIYKFPLVNILVYSTSAILFLILCKSKNEKQQEIIEKNIREYYEKNNQNK